MRSSRLLRSYGIAALATVLAFVLNVQLASSVNTIVFSTYYLAVVCSAWYGGFGPGMMSALASAAVTPFLFPGTAAANADVVASVRLLLFVITGTLISWTIAYLQKLRRELERRVHERTAELSSANRRLQQAEERFRNAFEHAPIGMALVSIEGRPLRVNAALCKIFGYTQEELTSMPIWAVIHPDDMPASTEQLQRLIDGESQQSELEQRYFHKDGHTVWGASRMSVVRDEAGRPQYVVSQVQDITARKQAEVALRHSEERFRALVEHAFDAVSLFTADGTLLYTTPNSSRIFGRSVEAVLGHNMLELTHPDDQALCLNAFAEILQKPGETVVGQFRQLHENGSWLWLEATVRNLLDVPSVGAIVANYHDISERKQAEEMLRKAHEGLEVRVAQRTADLAEANRQLRLEVAQREEAEARIRREKEFSERLINSSLDGILAFDRECRYTLWNPGMERMTGITAPQVLGKCAFDVFPFLREIGQQEVFDQVLRGHNVTVDARPYPQPTRGERGFFESYYSPLYDDAGETIGGLAIVRDVTAHKHADEQLEGLNKRITSILESMTAAFFAVDNEQRLTYVNHAAEELVQGSRETLLGNKVWDVFSELLGSTVHKQYEQVRAQQVPIDAEAYFPRMNRWFRAHMYPTADGISALFEDITERHVREMRVVSNILRALNAEIDVATAYPSVAAGIQMLTDCSRSALGMFDAQRKSVTIVALDQTEGPFPAGIQLRMADFPGIAEVLTGEPHLVPDLEAEYGSPVIERAFDDGFRSGMGVPLRGTKGVMGMLILLWQRRGGPNAAQLPLVRQVADAVALAAEKSNLFEQVRVKRERLQTLSQRLIEVQEEERRHIARELHDEIGQNLTGLKLLLDSVGHLPPECMVRLEKAQELVDDLIGRVRDLSLDLRPAMLDDIGLLPALLWLFERYTTQTAVRVSFEHKGLDQRVAPDVTTAAYRIVQEALTNVARYAGVDEVAVRAWTENGSLKLQVVDHGTGFDADGAANGRGTCGLAGMRERALLLGGRLTVSSAAGTGTRINAELPIARS